jgi:5-methylcytosine-specific restriction protein B
MDLTTDEGIRAAREWVNKQNPGARSAWIKALTHHLARIREANEQEFKSTAFQRMLWDSEAISATGMGHIPVAKLIEQPEVGDFLWKARTRPWPESGAARAAALAQMFEELKHLISPHVIRNPRLKMFRVMAGLFPRDFTTIAHAAKLVELARNMGLRGSAHDVQLHRMVLDRLETALGPVPEGDLAANLERMTLPWHLYAAKLGDPAQDSTETAGDKAGESILKPLPPARRRRGLLAIGGLLPSVLAMLEFAREGCAREDFRDHLRSINSGWKRSTINTITNALISEWDALRADGERITLTPRGSQLLETQDPDEVADWMLTRILGFDNVLHALRQGPMASQALVGELQSVNPGWTTNYAPTAMLNWMRNLGLIAPGPERTLRLTERGEAWAGRIHWTPALLEAGETEGVLVAEPAVLAPVKLARANFDAILRHMPEELVFGPLVARLDAALWAHERRHFAVLTGLSGAGKTQLARCYARALWAGEPDRDRGLYILPVQPGWHDPSALLGYVNPLDTDSYVRTGFLEFLLDASRDPGRPYTVVLDEMNLSHPEQYFAPLLSAMETGHPIELHAYGIEIDGVPAKIPYPANLLVVGTVNMDETTHGLSDKVLDRATVIEFWDIDVAAFPGWTTSRLSEAQIGTVRDLLVRLNQALRPMRLHFGWRVIGDVLGYVAAAVERANIDFREALDQAVHAKILPKLRGDDSQRMRSCIAETAKALNAHGLQDCGRKIRALDEDLQQAGSARFWR